MDAVSGLGIPMVNHREWIDRMTARFGRNRAADGPPGRIGQRGPEAVVAKFDRNGDGRVDSAELMGSPSPPRFEDIAARLIRHRDVDGDEVLSVDELRLPETTFNRIDQNDDGEIDQAELAGFLRGADGQPGVLELPHSGSAAGRSAFDYVAAKLIQHRDRDGDEMLSVDEWPVPGDTFDRLDMNDDGEADQAELVDFLRGVPGGPGVLGPSAKKRVQIAPVPDDDQTNESQETLSLLDENEDEQAAAQSATIVFPRVNAYEKVTAMLAARANTVEDILYL